MHAQRIDRGASDVEAFVCSWRYLIAVQLASLALSRAPQSSESSAQAIRQFLTDNYGQGAPQLDSVLRPSKLRLSSLSFEPQVFGCKLGAIALDRGSADLKLGMELNALSELLLAATIGLARQLNLPAIMLHFDELDQGISTVTKERARMLAGLVLAARSVRQACRTSEVPILPVVYLRTDLWDELSFSDKNKISETQTLRLEWNGDSLLDLVGTRLRAKLGAHVTWDSITTPDAPRGANSKWSYVVGRTFLRPRDVIKFLNAALERAKQRADDPLIFLNEDIVAAREPYSRYLKDELDDEILPHWRGWEDALQACSGLIERLPVPLLCELAFGASRHPASFDLAAFLASAGNSGLKLRRRLAEPSSDGARPARSRGRGAR